MKTLLISAAVSAALIAPSAATAQAIPGAIIAVVDLDRVSTDCNACKTAQAALRSQVTAEQTREQNQIGPLQTEQQSIQAAVDALKGQEPDAALQARVKAFQTKYQQAQQDASRARDKLQANQQYVQKQIMDKLGPIYTQVMQRRGANVMVEAGATLAVAQALDVTSDVVAALNTALPTISTTAPAQPAPQGR